MKFFFLILGLYLPLFVYADEYPDSLSRLSIEGGPNYSIFINADDPGVISGFTIGLRYDCYLSKKVLFSLGFLYSKEGGTIRNLYAAAGYLKFPFTYGYPLYFQNHKEITFYGGFAFLLPVKDYTTMIYNYDINTSKKILSQNNVYTDDSDGVAEDGSFRIGKNKNISVDMGFLFKYKQIMLDFHIDYQLLDFGEFGYNDKINKNLFSVKILFGLFFK